MTIIVVVAFWVFALFDVAAYFLAPRGYESRKWYDYLPGGGFLRFIRRTEEENQLTPG